MVKVKFTSDFSVKRIGDVIECDSQLASQLVNNDKVAEYTNNDVTKIEEEREYLEPNLKEEDSDISTEKVVSTVENTSKKTK